MPGVFYKASLSFEINRSTGFAISAYPFLGLSLTLNSQTGGSGSFGAALPVLGEIHFGDLDDACFYVGAGFSAAYLASTGAFGDFSSGPVIGPQFGLGGQFNLRDRLMGVRLSYTYGLNKIKNDDPEIVISTDRKSMVTFGVYYVLGQ